MRVTIDVELAMEVITVLRTKRLNARTEDLASDIDCSVHYLEQIMRKLRIAGIVVSKKGPSGGYTLNANKTKVTAYDVHLAVGKEFEELRFDKSPADRLRSSILEVYKATLI